MNSLSSTANCIVGTLLLFVTDPSTVLFPADSASTVPGLLSIFHEQEMTETVHDTNGHGYLATFVGKNGR